MMGSPEDEHGRHDDEIRHEVTISRDFYMGKYEVTQAQWEVVMWNNPSDYQDMPNHPVEPLSWHDCRDFIEKLNEMSLVSGEFRLPTEAEWEYACRAGTTTRYYWGDDPEYTEAEGYASYLPDDSGQRTKEVGQKLPNAWGLYDMSGNVWEWCQDWRGEYPTGPVVDPIGPQSGTHRIMRGGSPTFHPWPIRSANRVGGGPNNAYERTGLRLVLSRVP